MSVYIQNTIIIQFVILICYIDLYCFRTASLYFFLHQLIDLVILYKLSNKLRFIKD